MPASSLLKIQIGPVQDFIAQARSTRDLWSGSYLLSFIVAAGIRELINSGGTLIFPAPEGQPLLADPASWKSIADQSGLLTPNLPNLFVAELATADPVRIAKATEKAIRSQWKEIAAACFSKLSAAGILQQHQQESFLSQSDTFLSVAWQITPLPDDPAGYAEAYGVNAHHLDAVRQTRDFSPNPVNAAGEKDSLSGRDHAFVCGSDAAARCKHAELIHLFKHPGDHLSAITLIKRVWHLAYLNAKLGLKTSLKDFRIRSTRAIAARGNESDDEDNVESARGEKYLAAIAFDGDSIGKWVSGRLLGDSSNLRNHHKIFSQCLSSFALNKVRPVITADTGMGVPLGFLVYAGGDDVVALVPADAALDVAARLRDEFRTATAVIKDAMGGQPDASAGIAIGHFKAPLQDLVREAQKAEKRAKNEVGRPAFSITLMKHSGEISHWGAKWDDGGMDLHEEIATLMRDEVLTSKFPHRVVQLLEPYLTTRTGLVTMQDASGIDAADLIMREFGHTLARQSPAAADKTRLPGLCKLLETYLRAIAAAHTKREQEAGKSLNCSLVQQQLRAVIGLCISVAFANRITE